MPNCDTWGTQPHGGITRAQYAASVGVSTPFTCLKDYSENGKSSAQIIYDIGQKYNINPQVLIVLLQKEQGLVTDDWPWSIQYRSATGYGCPDTAPCDAQYYGLTNQLDWAAKMFRSIMDNSPNWYTPYVLGDNYIQYSPVASCGGSVVYIQNRSTQALYNYTPYQPNDGAIAAEWGTAPCGAYGNRNFYLYFTSWFGSTQVSKSYAWRLVSQEAFIDSTRLRPFTDEVAFEPGQKIYIRIRVQNMGYSKWNDTVRLATTNNRDRSSIFADTSWNGTGRINKMESTATWPAEFATYEFTMTAPSSALGSYNEYFSLVNDGVEWMNDPGMYYSLHVTPKQAPTLETPILSSNQELSPGKNLISADTQSILAMQYDGNLALYSQFKPKWSSGTTGNYGAKLVMQPDGNLVIYDTQGQAKWASGTNGNAGAYLTMQSDGNLVIYSSTGVAVWNSGSASTPDYLSKVTTTLPISAFYTHQSLQTTNRKYNLVLQTDGNLVLYSSTKAIWASGTNGRIISHLSMQPDGNLVLYDKDSVAAWNSGTNSSSNQSSRLSIQDDGNLVIYNGSGRATWSTNTRGK